MFPHCESAAGQSEAVQRGMSHLQPSAYYWRRDKPRYETWHLMFPNEMKSLFLEPKYGPGSIVRQKCLHVTWTGFAASI